jgi:AmmeMemoRadiSam system protein B/AmmeMemoRadiSam system protein A
MVESTRSTKPDIRPCAGAGQWFPGRADDLRAQIALYFKDVPDAARLEGKTVTGLIVPHAGYTYSGPVAAYAYKTLEGRAISRVIGLAFSHSYPLRGACVIPKDFHETPLGLVPVEREACEKLLKEKHFSSVPQADRTEHSLENQLPFLQCVAKDWKLIPVLVGDSTEEELDAIAESLAPYVTEGTVVLASSDFTHYGPRFGYVPFKEKVPESLKALDLGALELILNKNTEGYEKYLRRTGATICGRNPIAVLMRLMEKDREIRGQLLRYDTSGRMTGDWYNSVSYVAAAFFRPGGKSADEECELTAQEQQELLKIARASAEKAVSGETYEPPKPESPGLSLVRGVFVTLKNHGELRGCLGNFQPTEPLYKAVAVMAAKSATEDPRFVFNRITPQEMSQITIDISVLSPMVRIKDPLDFKIGVHGIYINHKGACGTFLPQVATEQGWDKTTFLNELCCHKIGIGKDAWKDADCEVYRYGAWVICEKE